jgi:voltage-gated sodium channel
MTTAGGAASAATSAARARRNNNYTSSETPNKAHDNKRRRDGTSDDALKKKMLMYGDDGNIPTMSNKEREFFHHTSTNTTTPYVMGEATSVTARHHPDDYLNNDSSDTTRSTPPWELGDPRNGGSKIGQIRDWCGWFVNCTVIQTLMTILILSNALLLGILTFESVLENESVTHSLEALDLAILSAFTVEFSLQLIYLGFSLVQNNWLIFDCIVVSFSWIFLDSSVAVLRSFRIFRIFSLVSKWESLRILFAAVGKTMPKMASIWLALMIFFYIFCVLCTTLYGDLHEDGYLDFDYFGRLDYTFLTLFQIMTLDSWTAVVRQVMAARPWAWLVFLAWVIITAFFVLNLVVAVICESLIEINKAKEQEMMGEAMQENNNKAAASALQMEDLVRQQVHMMNVQQDLIRSQVEMQQTLNMIMFSMKSGGGGGGSNPATGGNGSNFGVATPGGGTSRSSNAMLLEQMISQEETSFHNSQDSSSFLHRFHSSSDSILSGHSRRLEEQ